MNLFNVLAADPAETHHWLLPETAEIIYGGIASVLVIGALVKFALPQAKKAMAARTERIQKELDASANDLATAQADASRIRTALGDIASERARLMADAKSQADALLIEGRARMAADIADMEAKADADIAASRSRSSDELRAQIAQIASVAAQNAVSATLNDGTKQELIEGFISSVGGAR